MAPKNYKVSLCGEPGVGKTSIALRQAQNSFPPVHQPTLGANFLIWNTILDGEEIRVIIADSGSQERFLPVLPTYFQGSLVAAIVFDVTSKESFSKINFWLENLKDGVGEIPIVIVGNKTDLKGDREVSIEEAETYAEELETEYFEVSAKDNINLFPLFKKMAEIAIKQEKQ